MTIWGFSLQIPHLKGENNSWLETIVVNNTWSEKQLPLVPKKCLLKDLTLPFINGPELKKFKVIHVFPENLESIMLRC